MVDYFNLVKGIKQDGRNEMEANETEIEQLIDIEAIRNRIGKHLCQEIF